MTNNLGSYFRDQRIRQDISLGQLARRLGYRNVPKGANKVCRFEREGDITEELRVRLADSLHIDLPTVERLMDEDHQELLREWEEWVSEPVPMHLVVRYMPAVYGRVPLPEEIETGEQAEEFACRYAEQHGRKVCLALSRRHSVWVDESGTVYARTEATPDDPKVPFMRLNGSRRMFVMRFKERK